MEQRGGIGLVNRLPATQTSRAAYFHEAVWGLRRRGMLTAAFFAQLAAQAATEEVFALAREFGVELRPEEAAITRRYVEPAPRVFISYAHEPGISEAVESLAEKLQADGVDAWIDAYITAPDEGWVRWMQSQIWHADVVLTFCSATYRRRFEHRGSGMSWERELLGRLLYEAGGASRQVKLIPILLAGSPSDVIPLALKGLPYYVFPDDYQRLLARVIPS